MMRKKAVRLSKVFMRVSFMLFLTMSFALMNGCGKKAETQLSEEAVVNPLPEPETSVVETPEPPVIETPETPVIETPAISEGAKEEQKTVVMKDDKVKVHYVGKFEDGTIFDQSKEGEPMEFIVQSGQVIPGFDKAVEGMQLHEKKEVTIQAEDAYGKRDETLVKQFPPSFFPNNFTPEKGMMITLHDKAGRAVPATIVDITKDSVTLDLNHPLAGKNLFFTIEVVGIE